MPLQIIDMLYAVQMPSYREEFEGKEVEVIVREMDRYGRYVGDVMVGGKSANAELVAKGFAWHYTQYSKDVSLAALEMEARSKRLGLWADRFPVPPWDFRHKKTKKG